MSEKKILQVGQLIKSTGYMFKQESDISEVMGEFGKNHRRLRVFHEKGLCCSNPACRNTGTRLILAVDKTGGLHWDIYTDSLILMNIDHIVAKSKGGKDYIGNLQPMCKFCNSMKGTLDIDNEALALLYHENNKLYKMEKNSRNLQKKRELRPAQV